MIRLLSDSTHKNGIDPNFHNLRQANLLKPRKKSGAVNAGDWNFFKTDHEYARN